MTNPIEAFNPTAAKQTTSAAQAAAEGATKEAATSS